jgi:hypothetical protein
MRRHLLLAALIGCLGLACGEARRFDQAIAVLIDVSGTYTDQRAEVVKILKRDVLPSLVPGDSLVVIRIDSQSYEKENVEAILTLDARPSRANAQKLELARKLDAFAARKVNSLYTDIPGAMMLGAEYLRELGSGSRVLLVFSDMQEDLPEGSVRHMSDVEFAGIRVVAMNVKRLRPDSFDPDRFRRRLAHWETRVQAASASEWRTFLDASKLISYLEGIR